MRNILFSSNLLKVSLVFLFEVFIPYELKITNLKFKDVEGSKEWNIQKPRR